MPSISNIVINSASISALYALVAIGFTLIFGVGEILNFAYAGQITLGAFIAFQLATVWGYSMWIALLVVLVTSGVFGLVLYVGVVRYVQAQPITMMVVTFLTGFSIEHLLRIFMTPDPITVPLILHGETRISSQIAIRNNSIFVFVSSWLLIFGLLAFINYSKTGKALIAMSNTEKGAQLVGINSLRINVYTWLVAGAFAGFAGLLIASFQGGSWHMGFSPMILAFSIVILGGVGSIRGSVLGAYIIGTLETITISVIDAGLVGFSALIVLLVVLLLRPQGLFGREASLEL